MPVEWIQGLGDEAYFDDLTSSLWFRSGPTVFALSAAFFTDEPGTAEKLITLAQQVLARA